jgi:hypothetical protein
MRDERRIKLNGKTDSKAVNEVRSLLLTRKRDTLSRGATSKIS